MCAVGTGTQYEYALTAECTGGQQVASQLGHVACGDGQLSTVWWEYNGKLAFSGD